jgi:hypothetical protein
MSDGNDFLMGGGIPSAKFAIKGASVRGVVTALPVTRPQTDMASKEVKRFANGDPMMQVVIRLQTEERDPTIEGDDGTRATYIKGASIKRLREAIRKTGAKGLEIGGYFTQTYVSDELPTGGLPQGAKVYEFTYTPPNALDTAEPAAPSYSPPATQPVPAANPLDALNDEQRKALAALGFKG